MPSWLINVLKPIVQGLNTALTSNKAQILTDVSNLATKDVPSVVAKLEGYIPTNGFLGQMVKPLIVEYITATVAGLTAELGAEDGTWFDELVAALEKEETSLGL